MTFPEAMDKTYIESSDKYSIFYRQIRQQFQMSGINVVDDPEEATAIFSLKSDQTGQRVLSVSTRNVPTEFEVFYSITYELTTSNLVLLPLRTQTLVRDYTWDEKLVLGKEKEEKLLRKAIVDDLTRIVLIQLSTL